MFDWLFKKEDHAIRFFGTKWSSPVSVKWYYKFPHWGVQLRDGWADVYFGKLAIRIRQQAMFFK